MRHYLNLLAFAAALAFLIFGLPSRPAFESDLEVHASLKRALAESIVTYKPLFVYFRDDADSLNQLLKNEKVARYLEMCVVSEVGEAGENQLSASLGVSSLPHGVLLNRRGEVWWRGDPRKNTESLFRTLERYGLQRDKERKRIGKFLDVNPNEAEGLLALGQMHLARDRYADAASAFKAILSMEDAPNRDRAQLGWAVSAWKLLGPQRAARIFQEFVSKYPQSEVFNVGCYIFGCLLRELDRAEEAEAYMATNFEYPAREEGVP